MPRAPRHRPGRLAAIAVAAALAAGCAGYAGDVAEIRSSLLAGNAARALSSADAALEVDAPDGYPRDVGGDTALLVLERASIKQALGQSESSALDFRVADKNLELLDLKHDTAGNIGKWLFSDNVTVYKAPPHEKLLLNALNMLNYLAVGDLEGARVEARRFDVVRRYVEDAYSPAEAQLGFGDYLAGFTYEMSGRYEQALYHYDRALAAGVGAAVEETIRRLAACDPFRTDRITALLAAGEANAAPGCDARAADRGTVLIVAANGLAPYKRAIRLPIGAALVVAGNVMYGPSMGMSDTGKANELAAKGLLTWINFPDLTRSRPRFARTGAAIDGRPVALPIREDVTRLVTADWDAIKGTLMGAAIVRMVTRAVAAEATQRGAEAGGAAGGLALLAGLAVEGALFAADTPDTRSWVTLPSEIFVARAEVARGRHQVSVTYEGASGRVASNRAIDVPPAGFAVVTAASMR
jgi:tetratricopeptide (TPR) repeat protein